MTHRGATPAEVEESVVVKIEEAIFDDATLAEIGRKHGASAAQVAIAWLLDQDGVMAIPKAARPESQKANLDALGIRLDDEDRAAIAALPKGRRYVSPAFAPDWNAAVA